MKLLNYTLISGISFILFLHFAACQRKASQEQDKGKQAKIKYENFQKTFVGILGSGGSIAHLNLNRYDTALSGSYWYKIKGKDYKLKGTMDKKGNFKLVELDSLNQPRAHLEGNYIAATYTLKGVWRRVGEKKTYAFELQEPVDTSFRVKSTIKIIQKEIIRNNGDCLVDVVYPQITGYNDEVLQSKVNYYIESNFSLAQIKDLMDDLEACQKGFKGEIKYEVRCFKGDLLSISKIKHINKKNINNEIIDETFGMAINFKKGKIYEVQDLFNLYDLPRLNQFIQNRINSNCNNGLNSADLRKCEIKPNDVNCFCIGRDNITFHLTQKLPRQMRGCGYVRFRFEDLKEFINPSGPIAKLLELQKAEREQQKKQKVGEIQSKTKVS